MAVSSTYCIPDKDRKGLVVRLSYNGKVKNIGKIKDGVYYKKLDPISHVMHKMNAVGFNCEVVDNPKFFWETAEVDTGKRGRFTYTREFIKAHGEIKTFQDYEPQYFVDL